MKFNRKDCLLLFDTNNYIKEQMKDRDSILGSELTFSDGQIPDLYKLSILYNAQFPEAIYKYERIYSKEKNKDKKYIVKDIKITLKKYHQVKLLEKYWNDVYYTNKTFELRKLDRDYKVGDYLKFDIVQEDGSIIETRTFFKITYILRDVPEYGLDPEYGILGIKRES